MNGIAANPDYSPGFTVRRATAVTAAAGEPARRLASPRLMNNPGFCNGPLDVNPPSDHLAAGFRLLSVVGAKAATSCDQKGAGEPI